jgi:hypothetical protein
MMPVLVMRLARLAPSAAAAAAADARASRPLQARPMPDFSQMQLPAVPTRKRLTNPQSPNLATSKRQKK